MKETRNLIYTPQKHIPIGEPVRLPNGGHGIRLKWKRGGTAITEVVPLDTIHDLISMSGASMADIPSAEDVAKS